MRFSQKSEETLSLQKVLTPRKLDEKAGIKAYIRAYKRIETIIHFRKNMLAQASFYH